MMRSRTLALLLALTLLTTHAGARRRAVGVVDETNLTAAEWLKRHAVPFATAEPRTGFDDLAPLASIVRDARIVSLGEATHGTREFFKMKHRVLEYLVENMGFTVFAIEAALPECDAINDYVLNGTGDPAKALSGQHFWTWNTEEVLDMILWMREYNLRRGDKPPVQFRGFDMQFSAVAMQKATEYLQRIDANGAAEITSKWSCFEPYANSSTVYNTQPASFMASCHASVNAAFETFESRRGDYVARSSAAEYETMLHYARVVVQHEVLLQRAGTGASSGQWRDAMMAENVDRLANVRHPGEKFVLWAHNYHVGRSTVFTMGSHLRKVFPGSQMVVFGFAFDHGSFTARPWPPPGPPVTHTVTPWLGDYDATLRTAGPRFIIDLRKIDSTAALALFQNVNRSIWAIGAVFGSVVDPSNYRERTALRNTYDAIIWIEETTASKVLPFV